MSLDFDVSNVKDYLNVTTAPFERNGQAQWHPVTEVLVWSSIPCGYNQINEENLDEVWVRVNVWQRVQGGLISGPDGYIFLNKEDVQMHIGLRTNATKKTETQFHEAMQRTILDSGYPVGKSAMKASGWKGRPADE